MGINVSSPMGYVTPAVRTERLAPQPAVASRAKNPCAEDTAPHRSCEESHERFTRSEWLQGPDMARSKMPKRHPREMMLDHSASLASRFRKFLRPDRVGSWRGLLGT